MPDRVAELITRNSSLIMLGMGAGPHADAQYLFSVLGHTAGHRPRHAKTYRNFAAEYERLQRERVAAYREFISDVQTGAYPEPQHVVPITDAELTIFKAALGL